jgi:hypothetical protein
MLSGNRWNDIGEMRNQAITHCYCQLCASASAGPQVLIRTSGPPPLYPALPDDQHGYRDEYRQHEREAEEITPVAG